MYTQYVSPQVPGFGARVKYRLTDFVVQELTRTGTVVPLSFKGQLLGIRLRWYSCNDRQTQATVVTRIDIWLLYFVGRQPPCMIVANLAVQHACSGNSKSNYDVESGTEKFILFEMVSSHTLWLRVFRSDHCVCFKHTRHITDKSEYFDFERYVSML